MAGIYNVFSKRGKSHPDVFQYDDLPQPLRVQLLYILGDTLPKIRGDLGSKLVCESVCEEHGLFSLTGKEPNRYSDTSPYTQQIRECLLHSPDILLLMDVLEMSLRVLDRFNNERMASEEIDIERAISRFNHRMREHGVGYQFDEKSQFLIRLDSTLLHESAILPVLSVLTDPKYAAANTEFITAFDDYKKGDFSDCVVKACSAYESVLKIVCDEKGWPHDPDKDTCGTLVQTVVQHGGLESFLTDPLKIIGSIRNKKSSAHGSGTTVRDVSEALARYCLNATASSILYVVESTQ